jgi:hypothetical protein
MRGGEVPLPSFQKNIKLPKGQELKGDLLWIII